MIILNNIKICYDEEIKDIVYNIKLDVEISFSTINTFKYSKSKNSDFWWVWYKTYKNDNN